MDASKDRAVLGYATTFRLEARQIACKYLDRVNELRMRVSCQQHSYGFVHYAKIMREFSSVEDL
jgi:hypothetical protein